MDRMFDLYAHNAELYDELVAHEDVMGNLPAFLLKAVEFRGRTVCEWGAGTGRVTRMYLDLVERADLFDASAAMLERARGNLFHWQGKINWAIRDNRSIGNCADLYDIVVEGWSFGHLVGDSQESFQVWADVLIQAATSMAQEKVVFIESLGTHVTEAVPPSEALGLFYKRLEESGFRKHVLDTSYRFSSYQDAARIMGGFFGDAMGQDIREQRLSEIREYTGMWIYSKK